MSTPSSNMGPDRKRRPGQEISPPRSPSYKKLRTANTPQSRAPTTRYLLPKTETASIDLNPAPAIPSRDVQRKAEIVRKVLTVGSKTSSLKVGQFVTAIRLAKDGRPYTTYRELNRSEVLTRGALIPAMYQFPNRPTKESICPVRGCEFYSSQPLLSELGYHFSSKHRKRMFNDNGDGTLSEVGSYERSGPGPTPGIVVSQSPLPSNDLLPVAPTYVAPLKKTPLIPSTVIKNLGPDEEPRPDLEPKLEEDMPVQSPPRIRRSLTAQISEAATLSTTVERREIEAPSQTSESVLEM
ncbi:hypothetical protein EDB81DRAFT_358631 [Dactylonectria macrodidyma]|uniref:Uncharacterized protein n=1 Tax=Dactylonectria macrodidyma TaxID=307937 RepID=A0A9P9D2U5_9HYPO|nr:hypothetical protein EDB81DRAFT_358631 [Dactylonectria macrodidyma]